MGDILPSLTGGVPRQMNEVSLLRRGGRIKFKHPPPRHLPTAGKLIHLHLRCRLIRATPPVQEGSFSRTNCTTRYL